jgi:hypothetical protein
MMPHRLKPSDIQTVCGVRGGTAEDFGKVLAIESAVFHYVVENFRKT